MTDARTEATCELCETPIVNGAAGWRHLMGMSGRGGCGIAEPPALPLVFEELEVPAALSLSGCAGHGSSMRGCGSCL
jgi:hypothetical protein